MMKKHSNNTTMILVAILSFLCGVMLIGGYSLHLRNKAEAEVKAEQAEAEAEKERQAELVRAQQEEDERKQNSSAQREDDKASSIPGLDVDKALGSDLSHIDLSAYAQDMDGLVKQLDALSVSGSDDTVYQTTDKAIRITRVSDTIHQVEISAETTYSLYHIFVGMLQTDATDYLQSKGYKLSNRDGQTCYRIDDYKLLYLKFDGTRVVDILLEVTSAAQSAE